VKTIVYGMLIGMMIGATTFVLSQCHPITPHTIALELTRLGDHLLTSAGLEG
jgi:hypothetical protein